jgi:predicted TIM-barrel fold metal-dependent hydrolase
VPDRVDANAFVGTYPFRALASTDVAGLRARLSRSGITRAVVSPLEAVFQEDSLAAEERLAERLAGSPELVHYAVADPARPGWERHLGRAVDALGVRGARLCALYHGYSLAGPEVDAFLACARERDLPVLVNCRMQDHRMQWMVHPTEPSADEVAHLLDEHADNRLIIAGLAFGTLRSLAGKVNARANVLVDTSRMQGPWRTFEKLTAALDPARLAFGSLWPICLPECPFEQVRAARLPDNFKEAILGGNFSRLMGR